MHVAALFSVMAALQEPANEYVNPVILVGYMLLFFKTGFPPSNTYFPESLTTGPGTPRSGTSVSLHYIPPLFMMKASTRRGSLKEVWHPLGGHTKPYLFGCGEDSQDSVLNYKSKWYCYGEP